MRLPATARAGLAVATVAAVLAVPSWGVSRAAVRAASGTCSQLLARHLAGVTTNDVARWTDATGDGKWSTAGNWTGAVPMANTKNVWVCVSGSSDAQPSVVDQSFALGGLEWGLVPLRICGVGDTTPCSLLHPGAISLWDYRKKHFSQLESAAAIDGSLSLCGGHDLHLSNGAAITNAGTVVLAGASELAGGSQGTFLNGKQGTLEYVDTGVSAWPGCTSGQTSASSDPFGGYITADFTNLGSVQVLSDGHPCPTDEYTGCDLLRVESSPIKKDVDSGTYLVDKGATLSVDADRAMSGTLKCAGQLWVTEASLTVPSGAQLNNCIVTVFTGNAGAADLLVQPGKTDIGTLDLAGGSVEATSAQPPGARLVGRSGDSAPIVKILRLGLSSRPCSQETGAFCGIPGKACTLSRVCEFGPGLDLYLGRIIPEPYYVQGGSARTRHLSQLATHDTVTFIPNRPDRSAAPRNMTNGQECSGLWTLFDTTLPIGASPLGLTGMCIKGGSNFVATVQVRPHAWGTLTVVGANIDDSHLELLLTKPLRAYPAKMNVKGVVNITKRVIACAWLVKVLDADNKIFPGRVTPDECGQAAGNRRVVNVTLRKP